MRVFVLNKEGRPLMPCTPRTARRLLEAGRAKVHSLTPFTVKLIHGSSGYTQPVTLGVDAGSRHIGFSACTDKEELYAGELTPRNDVVSLLSERRALRRSRRSRKTRHRAPRFRNRVRSKHKGWLAPSVEVKVQEHVSAIRRILRILPVKKLVVETAEFDLQRLKAASLGLPLPEGAEYQKGELYDQYNVRQYVLWRDGYACRACGAKSTEKRPVKFHVHHLESRKTGGNAPGNLVTLCEACHRALHEGKLELKLRRSRPLRDASFMGIMRKTLIRRLRAQLDIPVVETFGYMTKLLRETHGIKKSHMNDARCIAGAPLALPSPVMYRERALRRHNRKIHRTQFSKNGVRRRAQGPYIQNGFRLWDKVLYDKIPCFVTSRRASGYMTLKTFDGKLVKDGVPPSRIKLLEIPRGRVIEPVLRND